MSDDPRDPLVDAALTATDGGDVDWERLSEAVPGERETIEELAVLAQLVTAFRGDAVAEAGADAADGSAQFRWGPLEVRHRLGAGSFGEVFIAWDPRLHREVALKLRRAGSAERSKRWLDEARRLARVRHPNVVTVYGADLHEGRAGLWMEPVRGRTLEERLRHEGPLGAREAALVGAELCGALAAVHGEGLVHGDVKTHNVMREGAPGSAREAGRIVLMDFGSAHESRSDRPGPGTPLFTAPEVLDGGKATPSSDLWSLGVMLYRLVSGRWPFEAQTLVELRARLAGAGPTPLRTVRSELPAGFVAAVERALERDPTRRWSDAAELERELLTVLGADRGSAAEITRRRAERRRRVGLTWALALIALIAGGSWLAMTRGPQLWRAWRMRGEPLVGELVAERAGPTPNAFLGSGVMNVGDLNGDGHDEVSVSAPGVDETGQVLLFTPEVTALQPILKLSGQTRLEGFGGMVAGGDLNGDGAQDLVVGSFLYDSKAGKDAGRVSVFFGGAKLGATPDVVIDGNRPAQYFGYWVSCGDVNGDGHDDLLVSGPYDSQAGPTAGRAWVYFGGPHFDTTPDLELSSGRARTSFGQTIAYAGDLNGDGFGDLVVGTPADPGGGRRRGAVYVYYGGPNLDDRPDLVLNGPQEDDEFGAVRQRTGDLNGDGYDDLVVGAEAGDGMEPRAGMVWIYFGGPDFDAVPDLRLKGERRGEGFGTWADGSQDLDGDGYADLFVSAQWLDAPNAETAGRGYVFLGGRKLDAVPDFTVTGSASSYLNQGCIVPGHDGRPGGLVIGMRNETRAFTQGGVAQLYRLARWMIGPPESRDGWSPGRNAILRWSGSTRADVTISTDGGRTWRPIALHAGGERQNRVAVPVPRDSRGTIRVRLASGPGAHDAVEREIPLAGS